MTEEEREQIRKQAREEADLLSRIKALEGDRDEIMSQNKALVSAVSQLSTENIQLKKDVKEAIDYKRTLDRYKAGLAWAIVLGAFALIIRPFVNLWDMLLTLSGLGK